MAKRKAKRKKAKHKRRPVRGRVIGGGYEREKSHQLSQWWSGKDDELLFWRTMTSGGRASHRRKAGKHTRGQHGDICATDPDSSYLTVLAVIEAKCGYKDTIHDLLDRKADSEPTDFDEWVQRAIAGMVADQTFSWIILHRRRQRIDAIFMGKPLWDRLCRTTNLGRCRKQVHIKTILPEIWKKGKGGRRIERIYKKLDVEMVGVPLDSFLRRVKRRDIIKLAKWWKKARKKWRSSLRPN